MAYLDCLRALLGSFGFDPIFLPDLSRSLDGIVPDSFEPVSMGGTTLSEIRRMGESSHTLVLGESLRRAGEVLFEKCGVPSVVVGRLMELSAFDRFLVTLNDLSGRDYPEPLKRERNRLSDAMLDAHFYLGGLRVAVGLEPDPLFDVGHFLLENGMDLVSRVTTTASPLLSKMPGGKASIGDLGCLETEARARRAEMLLPHSHGRQGAERLGIPLFRLGFPVFDRLGAAHRLFIGYRGAMETLFRLANLIWSRDPENRPDTWHPECREGEAPGSGRPDPEEESVPVRFHG